MTHHHIFGETSEIPEYDIDGSYYKLKSNVVVPDNYPDSDYAGVSIGRGCRYDIDTGVILQLPSGVCALITQIDNWLSDKVQIYTKFVPSDYHGNIYVTVHNIYKDPIRIDVGDVIAGLVIFKTY